MSVDTHIHALTLEQPLEIDDARRAARALAEQRRASEHEHERLTREAAEKGREYRHALARAFVTVEGRTAAEKEANARAAAADAEYAKYLAEGMVKVVVERLRGLEGERSQLKSLMEWSARMRLDENASTR